jgi:hypothetical protein
MFKLLAACLLALLSRSSSEECIVSRRLPAFGLSMQRKEHTLVARATEISVCKRGDGMQHAREPTPGKHSVSRVPRKWSTKCSRDSWAKKT